MIEGTDQFVTGIDGAFDLQRMQHSVAFNDHVDLVAVAVTVVPQQTLLSIIMV